ncbi:Uncharacterised protein [uncultured archaeon]|nr:Uncharacterised protein [uncultured archaeon]
MTDAMQTREKIISIIKERGPILPVQIARETGLSILFASAFLSELYSEKEVNMSNIRVGSSPLYFISGQEPQLEKFSQYLKGKEKEAFIFLKEKKVLKDSALQPAIRVALKEIKDFAIPFQKNNEIFWRYFLIEELPEVETEIIEEIKIEPIKEESKVEEIVEDKGEIENVEKGKEISTKEKIQKRQKIVAKSKKPNKKKDENFFNKIKESLSKKGIEILDIKDFKNDEAILRVKKESKEELIFAFNKKKITEKEILKANKRASEEKMPYSIFSLGEAPKKLIDLISAIQNLSNIENIED